MRERRGDARRHGEVSLACADGDVCDFSGERGAERQVQRRNEATGYYWHRDIDGTTAGRGTPAYLAPPYQSMHSVSAWRLLIKARALSCENTLVSVRYRIRIQP